MSAPDLLALLLKITTALVISVPWAWAVGRLAALLSRAVMIDPRSTGYWAVALLCALLPLPLSVSLLGADGIVPWPSLTDLSTEAGRAGDALVLTLRDTQQGYSVSPLWRGTDWRVAMGVGLAGIYGLGLLAGAWRLIQTLIRLRVILRTAREAGPEFKTKMPEDGIAVLVTEERVSPFAIGGPRPAIVLPEAVIEAATPDQIAMIMAHERAHILRRDPEVHLALAGLDTLFWFNPFIRTLTNGMRLAAEFACDAAALKGEPAPMRKAYASAYLTALRITAGKALPRLPAAFSPHHLRSEKMRIQSMLAPDRVARKRPLLRTALGLGALVMSVSGAMTQSEVLQAATDGLLAAPLEAPARLTSDFGMRKHPISGKWANHRGIDIGAPYGTSIHAPADGVVTLVKMSDKGYGNRIHVKHENGLTFVYAQLQSVLVTEKEKVEKGQVMAYVGSSGTSTGPHLHLEVRRDDEVLDPKSVIDISRLPGSKPKN